MAEQRSLRLYVQTWTLGRTIQTVGGPLSYRKISQLVIAKRLEDRPQGSAQEALTDSHSPQPTAVSPASADVQVLSSVDCPLSRDLFTVPWVLEVCGGPKSLLLFPLPHT